MANLPNLQLPLLAASQAQKHITHNEALRILDTVVQLSCDDAFINNPPMAPVDGQRYIVGGTPTGAWVGHAGDIATWITSGWQFIDPQEGWIVWVRDEDKQFIFNGTQWVNPFGVISNIEQLGINATPDATNKLAVASSAVLFNHIGNGVQIKINKNVAGDSATFLFQTGFSGRAEIGTAGNDNFHFKTSPDGAIFNEALVLDTAGRKLMGHNTAVESGGGFNPGVQIHRTSANQENPTFYRWSADAGGAQNYILKSRGATPGTHTIVQNGDDIGLVRFGASDGVQFIEAGYVRMQVDGSPGTNVMPSRMIFAVNNGGANAVEALRIRSDLQLQFSAASFAANGGGPAGTPTISTLPAGAAAGASNKWLVIRDAAGVDTYIPVWQ